MNTEVLSFTCKRLQEMFYTYLQEFLKKFIDIVFNFKVICKEEGEMINSFNFLNRMYCMQTLTNVRSTQIKYKIQFKKTLYNYVNDHKGSYMQ